MDAINDDNNDKALNIIANEENLDINHKNRDGDTALTLALAKADTSLTLESRRSYHDIAVKLIEKGVSQEALNQHNKDGQTPITLALKYGHNDIAKKLIKAYDGKGIINHKNKDGDTVLYLALSNGQTDIAAELIPIGVPSDIINKTDSFGNTLLHYAKTSSVYSMLIEAGADPQIKNKNGETAYDRLSWMSRFSVWINDIYKSYFKPKSANNVVNRGSTDQAGKISVEDINLNFIKDKIPDINNTISTASMDMPKKSEDPKINITKEAQKSLSPKNTEDKGKSSNLAMQ